MTENQHPHAHSDQNRDEPVANDPACGMSVDPHSARYHSQHVGRTWYFCSPRCQSWVDQSPDRYIVEKPARDEKPNPDKKLQRDESAVPGTMCTCPMHPQIRQSSPGDCPICGMALEPDQISLGDDPSEELIDMTHRFWIGLVLTLPVFVLEMGGHLTGLDHIVSVQMSQWMQLALATPVVLWCGWPFFVRGWKSMLSRNLNMLTLIAIGRYRRIADLQPVRDTRAADFSRCGSLR